MREKITAEKRRYILDIIRAFKYSKTWNEEKTKINRVKQWKEMGLYKITDTCLDEETVSELETAMKEHLDREEDLEFEEI